MPATNDRVPVNAQRPRGACREVHRHVLQDPQQGPLRMHDALGRSGGAAGVADDRQVVEAARYRRTGRGSIGEQAVPVVMATGRGSPMATTTSCTASRSATVPADRVRCRRTPGRRRRPASPATSGGTSRSLTWTAGKPAEEAAEVRLDGLDPVGDHQRDMIPGSDPETGQGVGEPGRVVQHLAMGPDHPAGARSATRSPPRGSDAASSDPTVSPGDVSSTSGSVREVLRRLQAHAAQQRGAVVVLKPLGDHAVLHPQDPDHGDLAVMAVDVEVVHPLHPHPAVDHPDRP